MLVEDVMTRQPPVCHRGEPVIAAVKLMDARDLRGIPVVDKDAVLVGVLSVDDLMRWEAQRGASRQWIRGLRSPVLVAHVMNHEAIATSPRASISDAAQLMQFVGRSLLPVLESDRALVGLVSANDVATAFLRSDDSIGDEVTDRLRMLQGASFDATTEVHVRDGCVTIVGARSSQRDRRAALGAIATVTGVLGVRADVRAGSGVTID